MEFAFKQLAQISTAHNSNLHVQKESDGTVNKYMRLSGRIGILTFALALLPGLMSAQTPVRHCLSMSSAVSSAQPDNLDVFTPIAKYISQGDADKLSAWFADNIEISILGESNTCSRSHSKQILKSFFTTYRAREFTITHKAAQANVKYALGTLSAGGEMFLITIFVTLKDSNYQIQQFKIESL